MQMRVWMLLGVAPPKTDRYTRSDKSIERIWLAGFGPV